MMASRIPSIRQILIQRQQIEQTLCRMVPGAVSRIDDRDLDALQLPEILILAMTDDHRVIAHALKCLDRVVKALSFFHAASDRGEIFHAAAQLMLRRRKGIVCPGAWLKKRLATSLRCGNCQSFCEAPKSCASMRMPMSSSFDRSRIRNRLFGFIAHPPVCVSRKKAAFFCTKKGPWFHTEICFSPS
mgnify:CR=1 FL=1